MTEEELILDQRVRHKRLFRSSRESYSDDDSDTNRTPVASVQQEEEVLYEIDPRALGKLPERLQNNYRQLFQERVERLAQKNPNFKYRQYDYMDYWPEEAFSPEEEEQPRYMKRKYPRKHKVLQGLEIAHVSRLKATEQKGQLHVMNPDLSPVEDRTSQCLEDHKDSTEYSGEKEIRNNQSEGTIDEVLATLVNRTVSENGSLASLMEEGLWHVNAPRKVDSRFQARRELENPTLSYQSCGNNDDSYHDFRNRRDFEPRSCHVKHTGSI
ncbi:conserved hypothetical protein [Histoplasma capsulatum var. duboisii H88]|uniref:Uncharacterized protein n=1 Tax=Ajellomyces capsulatus (strain H88) TaxID=544711 RepID=F0UAK0_AJEC8|nr:conserved hypothetical protein [Histoplasma capsulatum var. duboisii H88]